MARAECLTAGKQDAPAREPPNPKLDERLEDQQRLENTLEDDEVRESLKRFHADQEKASAGKPT